MWSSVVNGKILNAGCEMDLSSHSVKLSSCISNTLTKTPKTIPQKIFSQLPIHHNPPDLSPSVVSVGHAVMSPSLPRPRPNLEAELHRAQRAWQAWHLWHWVAPLGPVLSPVMPRYFAWQACTWWHPPSFHVAAVAQTHINGRFAWQAWQMALGGALGPGGGALGPGFVARDAAAVCVAGVALGDIHFRFTWPVWRKLTSTFVLRGRRGTYGIGWRPWARICRLWRRGTLRGRRGTWWHPLSFTVAGVAQTHIHGRFASQAWLLWYWVARLGPDLSPVTPRHFAWQPWHLVTSTFVSRGSCGTNSHPRSFCVAGVALMALGGALGPGFVARDAAAVCVAGVALGGIHLRFTWQAWHNLTSTVVLRGRRGTYGTGWRAWARICRLWRRGTLRGSRGTWWHPPSFHVAVVAQTHIHGRFAWQAWHLWHWVAPLGPVLSPVTPRLFAWQAWHLVTSTFVSRGRCGTWSHLRWFCVAGGAQSHIHLRFAWHHLWHTLFHTPLCHTPSFTHHLSHPTLSPTIFHAPSFTHHFVTHHLWHTIFHTQLCHTHHFVTHHLWHTLFYTPSL